MPSRLKKGGLTGSDIYRFTSKPSLIDFAKKPEKKTFYYGSLIADQRVMRGITCLKNPVKCKQSKPEVKQSKPEVRQSKPEIKPPPSKYKYRSFLNQLKRSLGSAEVFKPHYEVDTSLYLVDHDDAPETTEGFTSVDDFVRAEESAYTPRKTGQDKQSQVYGGDLFLFNQEVIPVIRVVVGKVMEQAENEVVEEELLSGLRSRQRQLEEIRNAEVEDERKLEKLAKRRDKEKKMMIARREKQLAEQREVADKIAALAFSQKFLGSLVPFALKVLKLQGYLYDPIQHDIENGFMAELMKDYEKLDNLTNENKLSKKDISRSESNEIISKTFDLCSYLSRMVLNKMIREIVGERLGAYMKCPALVPFENDFSHKFSLEIPTIEENLVSQKGNNLDSEFNINKLETDEE